MQSLHCVSLLIGGLESCCICCCCSVGGFVSEDGTANVPVLCLDEHVGHPVVVVGSRVTHGLDAHLVTDAAASQSSATDHAPLHGAELTTAEVSSHTGSAEKHGSGTCTSETHGEAEGAPATLSFEESLLGEEVAVGRLDDLVGGLVAGGVVAPSTDEGFVEELSAFPHGAGKHSWHFLLTNNIIITINRRHFFNFIIKIVTSIETHFTEHNGNET